MVCQLTANVHGYGTCVEDVYYEQPPAEGESEKETKMRADRHRRREQVALEWLSYGVTSGWVEWQQRSQSHVCKMNTMSSFCVHGFPLSAPLAGAEPGDIT